MRKKLFALLLATTLVLSSVITVSAANIEPEPTDDKYKNIAEVTGAQAVEIASDKDENTVVIDLRSAADYEQAHVKGTVSVPVCLPSSQGYAVTEELRTAFKDYASTNLNKDSKVYLLCYAGTFCVNYASKWLQESGLEKDQLYRVNNGTLYNTSTELTAACNQASVSLALAQFNAGEALILDVRAEEVYQAGHLDKSLHQPLFNRVNNSNVVTSGTDELATNFTAFVNANKALLESKPLYILCNSGSKGAAAAHSLLANAKLNNDNVYTIDGGATNKSIQNLYVENQSVSAKDAIEKIGSDDTVIIDLRTAENYAKGHLKGALSMPVFGAKGVTSGSDELAQAFLASVQANADKLAGKNLYILCNSGARGAVAATKLLMQVGYSNANIFTIAGGAKDETVKANLFYVSDAQALAVQGESDYVILDVRNNATYEKGHLNGSLHMPIFDASNGVTDETKAAFTAAIATNAKSLNGKTIYILCNSGARGAQNANTLLKAAGYTNVFTIEGGAKNASIQNMYVHTVTGADAVAKLGSTDTVVIDVRNKTNYDKGHLKGSIHMPIFDASNNVTDETKAAFVAAVKANKDALSSVARSGKQIYILCNSGNRGAIWATKLLVAEGYSNANIFTIAGGAKDETVKANLTTESTTPDSDSTNTPETNKPEANKPETNKPGTNGSTASKNDTTATTPKTGDVSTMMVYSIAMLAAVAVIFANKKRLAK